MANDDDATGDDDDATGDDDDATMADDDDATGDDDDATMADDDDSAGDDDDSATGDDDDSASTGYVWDGDIYCLDWTSVTWVNPSAAFVNLAATLGLNLTDLPMLLSPLTVDPTFEMRISGGIANTCTQNLTIGTIDEVGTWTDPVFGLGPVDLSFSLTAGTFNAYDVVVDGTITGSGLDITNSSLSGYLDLGTAATTACSLVTCVNCPGTTSATCIDMQLTNATWDNVGAGPLVFVP